MPDEAGGLDAARQEILAASLGTDGSVRGALFELAEIRDRPSFRPVLLSPGLGQPVGASEIAGDGLLPRWLRVNDAVLPIPDSIGIYDELSDAEQRTLRALGTKVCLPLVHDGELTAWIALAGEDCEDEVGVEAHAYRAMTHAHAWASRLHQAKSAWRATLKAESVSRVNRLSVTGALAASIAHEVRSPLAAVRSIVQMIRDKDAPAVDHDRLLTTVIDEVDRISEVLSRMLTLGQPHTTRQEPCDFTFITDAATDFCRAYAKRQGQRLVRSGTDRLDVVGDPHELHQVLVNVLLNACQASEAGTAILIETSRQPDEPGQSWAAARITDRGVGIPADDLPKVFDAFFSTKPGGGGLGLAICREVVERHGGRVFLTSREGHGTAVTIQLPQ
jgi:signal transduction histidine kinase